MLSLFGKAKFSKYGEPETKIPLKPTLSSAYSKSKDPAELAHYWTEVREQTGKKLREMWIRNVALNQEVASLNGYEDLAKMNVDAYESETFIEEMAETWQGLKPLYEQLHAYVRSKLPAIFPDVDIDPEGPIPVHLLGQMDGLVWSARGVELAPFPDKSNIDLTQTLKDKGWTVMQMFEAADDFFQSMGFEPMTKTFWEKSMFTRPEDREVVCHPSAFDFYVDGDYRIKMCSEVTAYDFTTAHHEMGHIQYFMQYRNQSFLFRNGANPGFHEGMADVLSIATATPVHYKLLGLLPEEIDINDEEVNLNALMSQALSAIAFMPYGYLLDKYRWDYYQGKISDEELNCAWVKARADIQGVVPPSQRSEEDFDPGAKFHVAADVGYVRYFTAFIYKFQFHKALCEASGEYDAEDPDTKPLHQCSFYGSKAAGDRLSSMLKLGSSRPWKEAMEVITGTAGMDTSAFRSYFKPLEEWLIEENRKNGVKVGWKVDDYEKYCK